MGDTNKPFDGKFLLAPRGGAVLGAFGGFPALGFKGPVTLIVAMLSGAQFLAAVHASAQRSFD